LNWSLSKSHIETNKPVNENKKERQQKNPNMLNSRLSGNECVTSLGVYQKEPNRSVVHKLVSRCLSQPHNILVAKTFQTRRLSLHLSKINPKLSTNKTQEDLALKSKWENIIQINRYFKGKLIETANGRSCCKRNTENNLFQQKNSSLLPNPSSQRFIHNEYKSGYNNKRPLFNKRTYSRTKPNINIKRKNHSLAELPQQLSNALNFSQFKLQLSIPKEYICRKSVNKLYKNFHVLQEESVILYPEIKVTRDSYFKLKFSVPNIFFIHS